MESIHLTINQLYQKYKDNTIMKEKLREYICEKLPIKLEQLENISNQRNNRKDLLSEKFEFEKKCVFLPFLLSSSVALSLCPRSMTPLSSPTLSPLSLVRADALLLSPVGPRQPLPHHHRTRQVPPRGSGHHVDDTPFMISCSNQLHSPPDRPTSRIRIRFAPQIMAK